MTYAEEFRPDIPSTARMYDYYLGGKDHYPADRAAAEQVIKMMPPGTICTAAAQNRQFLSRVVHDLAAEYGIRQFLDIGTGLPTMNSVHEVAMSVAPDSRVVYDDYDPVVLAHARDLLHGVGNTMIIARDLRDPESILADPELNTLLDLSKPVAVLLVAVLHFISDEENPRGIIDALMKPLAAGSFLVISHATADSLTQLDNVAQVYKKATSSLYSRRRDELEGLFAGYDLINPGIVRLPQWHPDEDAGTDDPGASLLWCGVARKA